MKSCTLGCYLFITHVLMYAVMHENNRKLTVTYLRSASVCVISLCPCSMDSRNGPTHREKKQTKKEHKNLQSSVSPNAQKLPFTSLMICLIIHAAHLRVT